ncbi:MAG: EF-hand domain-containing protein [Gammaproteobacteria bacterium]|nr:EF-hand domain-containing protein [Gammaproteobacteria bacterium]
MKTIARAITFGWLIAVPSLSLFAADLPARGPIPFAAYDTNKDGTISPEEFYAARGERMGQRAQAGMPMRGAASAPSFEEFDTDHDGRLTESELRLGQTQRMQQGPNGGGQGMGRGMGPGRGQGQGQGAAPRNLPSFADYDLNADGRLTQEEFETARGERIQERAQQGGLMRNLPNAPAFADLDTDGDGTISADEFAAHQAQRRGRP